MDQHETIKRTQEICTEFDTRVGVVGIPFARAELAKALAEEEGRTALFSDCLSRALQMWQALHPGEEYWPDGAVNLAWVFDRLSSVENVVVMASRLLDSLEEHYEYCPMCETAGGHQKSCSLFLVEHAIADVLKPSQEAGQHKS